MDPIKLADQSINGAATDLSQGTATNRTQVMRHTLISFTYFLSFLWFESYDPWWKGYLL